MESHLEKNWWYDFFSRILLLIFSCYYVFPVSKPESTFRCQKVLSWSLQCHWVHCWTSMKNGPTLFELNNIRDRLLMLLKSYDNSKSLIYFFLRGGTALITAAGLSVQTKAVSAWQAIVLYSWQPLSVQIMIYRPVSPLQVWPLENLGGSEIRSAIERYSNNMIWGGLTGRFSQKYETIYSSENLQNQPTPKPKNILICLDALWMFNSIA